MLIETNFFTMITFLTFLGYILLINRNCGDLCHLPLSSIFIFVARASPVALPFATNQE